MVLLRQRFPSLRRPCSPQSEAQRVVLKQQKLLKKNWRPHWSNGDPVLRDALKRDFEERVASISAAQISLDGPSPYDSSILAGEFRSGAGDSMLQQQSSNGKTVFFFNGARLWKTFQELPASADKDSLVAELSERSASPACGQP